MTITDKDELIINIDGRTKLISREQIIKAFAEPKANCANYERDNVVIFEPPVDNLPNSETYIIGIDPYDQKDPIVEAVRQKLLARSQVGIKKYGTTLKDNTKDNYLNHLQMELMDAANYLEVLLQQEKDITQIVKDEPNDEILGRKIRKYYGSKD